MSQGRICWCIWRGGSASVSGTDLLVYLKDGSAGVSVGTDLLVYLRDGSAQTVCTRCRSGRDASDGNCFLPRQQYTDTGQTSPSTAP